MANELSNLKPQPGSVKSRMRIGRGEGSGKGKTSGRGQKGQGSRAGEGIRPGFEGGQMPLQRRLPKRGFTNIFAKEFTIVNLTTLEGRFGAGDVVNAQVLKDRGFISNIAKNGLKVLGEGELTVGLTVQAARFSKAAEEKIRAAGGSVEVV